MTEQRFTLVWESQNAEAVKVEADRVDDALDAVAERVEAVSRQMTAGRSPLEAFGQNLGQAQQRASMAQRAIDAMTRAAEGASAAAGDVGAGFRGVNGSLAGTARAAGELGVGFRGVDGSLAGVARGLSAVDRSARGASDTLVRVDGAAGTLGTSLRDADSLLDDTADRLAAVERAALAASSGMTAIDEAAAAFGAGLGEMANNADLATDTTAGLAGGVNAIASTAAAGVSGLDAFGTRIDRSASSFAILTGATGKARGALVGLTGASSRAQNALSGLITGIDRMDAEVTGSERGRDELIAQLRSIQAGLAAAEREAKEAGAALAEVGQNAEAGGSGLEGASSAVEDALGGFDALGGRLGQVSNALNLLSGVALFGLIDGLKSGVTAIYEMTDAGKAAKREAEALARAFDEVASQVEALTGSGKLTDIAAAQFVSLAGVTAEASAELEVYREAITEAAEQQVALNRAQREHQEALALAQAGTVEFGKSTFETGRVVARTSQRLVEFTAVAEAARAKLVEKREAQEAVVRSLEKTNRALDQHISRIADEARAWAASTIAVTSHRFAWAAAGGDAEGVIGVLGRLAGAADMVATSVGDKMAKGFKESSSAAKTAKRAIDEYTLSWMELGRVMQETGNLYLQYGKEAVSLESFKAPPALDFSALGKQLAEGLNAGLARVQRIGDALGIGAAHDDLARLFETIGEHAANARSVLGDVSSTVGVMGQIGALESSNAVQRAKNRARDAKGQKEQIAAQKALLAAEKAAEQERRRMQALDFALKAADNAGAAIEEVAKAAGAYPDPVGMALHGFAALKHGAAAAFYGRGVSASLSAPSAVGGGGLGPGTPSAPTAADRPVDNGDQRRGGTTIVLNGILADGRAVRTATTDALNTVGDGQIPIDTDGGL